MRFEGFGEDSSSDFWMNLGSRHIYPLGYCAMERKTLVPPRGNPLVGDESVCDELIGDISVCGQSVHSFFVMSEGIK